MRCELLEIPPLVVAVAHGAQLQCQAMCKAFSFTLLEVEYTTDVYIVPLGCCDMVLGVQWLATLGLILWNFEDLTMEFSVGEKRQLLKGNKKAEVKRSNGNEQKVVLQAAQLFALHITPSQDYASKTQTGSKEPQLSQLLKEYAEPKSLPAPRSHDHKITLKEGTSPINVRPYRYSALQKDVIEQTIKEMLRAGVVRPSQGPYSSPIVLVKKKDMSWRLCVDYRQLNKHTILDKFPIPVVEELLDELHGDAYFSKINIRSGYWQVRMHPEDVHKTAFRTHEGHYEFLVMPFRLTNAPSTF